MKAIDQLTNEQLGATVRDLVDEICEQREAIRIEMAAQAERGRICVAGDCLAWAAYRVAQERLEKLLWC
jgi:hypothetical protein